MAQFAGNYQLSNQKRGCNKSPYNEFKPRSDHVGPGGAFGWPLGGGEKGP